MAAPAPPLIVGITRLGVQRAQGGGRAWGQWRRRRELTPPLIAGISQSGVRGAQGGGRALGSVAGAGAAPHSWHFKVGGCGGRRGEVGPGGQWRGAGAAPHRRHFKVGGAGVAGERWGLGSVARRRRCPSSPASQGRGCGGRTGEVGLGVSGGAGANWHRPSLPAFHGQGCGGRRGEVGPGGQWRGPDPHRWHFQGFRDLTPKPLKP